MAWATMLVGVAGPIATKVLKTLGVGVITYIGFNAMKDNIEAAIVQNLNDMAANVYNVLAMAGFVDAIGITLSAMSTILAMMVGKQFGILS